MSGWNAKYKNDFGEYEITFFSKDYEKVKAVEKVCCAIMDGMVKSPADLAVFRPNVEMVYSERCKIYARAIDSFGERAQIDKFLEEFAELQEAVLKHIGGRDSREHIAEEIADVTIMLEQLRLIFGVNELVNKIMGEKLRRLERKLSALDKNSE